MKRESGSEVKYDITVRVADPADPTRHVESTFGKCPRTDQLLAMPIVGDMVAAFEEVFGEDMCESCGEHPSRHETDDMVSLCDPCWESLRTEKL